MRYRQSEERIFLLVLGKPMHLSNILTYEAIVCRRICVACAEAEMVRCPASEVSGGAAVKV